MARSRASRAAARLERPARRRRSTRRDLRPPNYQPDPLIRTMLPFAPALGPWFHHRVGLPRIDAAIHNEVPSSKALFPYLPAYWVEHVQNTMFKGPTDFYYPPTSPITARPGSRPAGSAGDAPTGARPGAGLPTVVPAASNLELLTKQV